MLGAGGPPVAPVVTLNAVRMALGVGALVWPCRWDFLLAWEK